MLIVARHESGGDLGTVRNRGGDQLRDAGRRGERGAVGSDRAPIVTEDDCVVVAEGSDERDGILRERRRLILAVGRGARRRVPTHRRRHRAIARGGECRQLMPKRAGVVGKAVQAEDQWAVALFEGRKRHSAGLYGAGFHGRRQCVSRATKSMREVVSPCEGWACGRRAAKPIRLRRWPGAPELGRCAPSNSGRAHRADSSSDASALAATSATRPSLTRTLYLWKAEARVPSAPASAPRLTTNHVEVPPIEASCDALVGRRCVR